MSQVCTSKMNLSDEVDLEDYVSRPDKISAAEISAICQEAGMHAVRKNRCVRGRARLGARVQYPVTRGAAGGLCGVTEGRMGDMLLDG